MAESTLTPTYDGIANDLAIMVNFPRTRATRSTNENTDVDACVNEGYELFLFPPWQEAGLLERYWTFVNYAGTLTLTASTATKALPEDFGGLLAGKLYYTDSDTAPSDAILVRPQDWLNARFQEDDDYEEKPEYACVRPLATFTAGTGQRWEMRFWPIPDAAYVVTLPYVILPNAGSSSNYMRGGMQHSKTLRAACRAVAERKLLDIYPGKEYGNFLSCLRSSHALDVLASPKDFGPYRPSGGALRYHGVIHGNNTLTYSP